MMRDETYPVRLILGRGERFKRDVEWNEGMLV